MATTPVTTTTPDPAFLDDFSDRWLDAWNRRDGQGLAALCTDDVEFFDPAIQTAHGRPAVAAWVDPCARAFPDYRFEDPEPAYVSRDRAKAIAPRRMLPHNTLRFDPPRLAPPRPPM